jgi:hypothetical protein
MVRNNEEEQPVVLIQNVGNELIEYLLVELAWSRGLEAGIHREAPQGVKIQCSDEEADELMQASRPGAAFLRVWRLELLAKAVVICGGTPSAKLRGLIQKARDRAGLTCSPRPYGQKGFSQN